MKHLIIGREYPPAPSGGIGTYVVHISQLLAESGEIVHVISQLWEGAEKEVEEKCNGRLIIHRVPFQDWTSLIGSKPNPAIKSKTAGYLFESDFHPQCFSWQASLLAEKLVEQEGIDIIEAQEFEAPLYYFQIRRALGFGPNKRPPCIVHLHSPMEFIVRYNDWDIGFSYFLTGKRLEDYSIAAADGLLCPSLYLARQIENHYGLLKDSIKVIPYPRGAFPVLERSNDIWKQGTICYFGRLERRKGVIEWIQAAVAVAYKYPDANFEFIGANILGGEGVDGEELVNRMIPKDLKMRFHFHGEQKYSDLPKFLKKARIAVVPSRWENFPNTCIEAMCSGLPVIASPEGGMREMIKDGQTGWLASSSGAQGLADALERALGTPSTKTAEMGWCAASEIHKICDNNKIVENQIKFRSEIVKQGSKKSLHLPVNLPWAKRPLSDETGRRTSHNHSQEGLAIVVTCFDNRQYLQPCLQSIKDQTKKPVAVVVVYDISGNEQDIEAICNVQLEGLQVIQIRNRGFVSAKNIGIEAALSSGLNPLGFAFLKAENRLYAGFVKTCESILDRCPEVGLVSFWTHQSEVDNSIWIRSCPSFPYQWLKNEAATFSVVRTEALHEAGNFRLGMDHGFEIWDLFNAVMAKGWVAVTIPELLGDHRAREDPKQHVKSNYAYWRMRRELLERFPDLINRDTKEIVILTESNVAQSLNAEIINLKDQLVKARAALRHPQKTGLYVVDKLKMKILRRTRGWLTNFISQVFS